MGLHFVSNLWRHSLIAEKYGNSNKSVMFHTHIKTSVYLA